MQIHFGEVEGNVRAQQWGLGAMRPIAPIYQRLPRGPHHLAPKEVARHQRLRMHGAMVEAVAANGYAGTSVKQVIGLAGVSRRAFYEQFANKEECFLATFDLIAARWVKRVSEAYRASEGDLETRLRASVDELADEVHVNAKGASLAIVQAQTAGAAGLARLRRAMGTFEQLLASSFAHASAGSPPPAPIVRGIVGGLHEMACARLRAGAAAEIPALSEEMVAWIMLFADAGCERLSAGLAARACASSTDPALRAWLPGELRVVSPATNGAAEDVATDGAASPSPAGSIPAADRAAANQAAAAGRSGTNGAAESGTAESDAADRSGTNGAAARSETNGVAARSEANGAVAHAATNGASGRPGANGAAGRHEANAAVVGDGVRATTARPGSARAALVRGHGHTRVRGGAPAAPSRTAAPTRTVEEMRACVRASMLDLVVVDDFRELSAPQIAEHAGVPIESFFDLYESKEACFMAAFDDLGDELLRVTADPELVSDGWARAARRVVGELLRLLAERPLYAHIIALEGPSATPQALTRSCDLAFEIATLLTEGAPTPARNKLAVEGVAGALWHAIRCQVASGQVHLLPALTDYLAYVVLTPFVGADAAAEVVLEEEPKPAALAAERMAS